MSTDTRPVFHQMFMSGKCHLMTLFKQLKLTPAIITSCVHLLTTQEYASSVLSRYVFLTPLDHVQDLIVMSPPSSEFLSKRVSEPWCSPCFHTYT